MSEPENTLADRVETAHQRSLAAADSATKRARSVIEDHPVAAVAGGVVIGALIASLLTRRKHAKADEAAAPAESEPAIFGRIAAIASQIALSAAQSLAEAGKEGADRAQHGADAAKDAIGKVANDTLATLIARFTRR